MENLLELLNMFNKQNENKNNHIEEKQEIPKEILDQYPYGEFPIRYTKSGQENIRKQSESRYLNETTTINKENSSQDSINNNDLNISHLIPLIQLMSSKNKSNNSMQLLTKLLFKDNKDIQKLFSIITKQKPIEIDNSTPFPETNKINISSLKKINT